MPRGDLFIVSAPSGAGKTTLIQSMMASGAVAPQSLRFSVSHTTRRPRAGEVDGAAYHFVAVAEFEQMIAADQFLEHANVYGNLYGTSRREVEPSLAAGLDVILDVDVQGAEQVLARMPTAVSIFILPPSHESLRQRLERRGADDRRSMDRRLEVAISEIRCYERYQYVIVNDDAARASRELAAIVAAQRQRLDRMRATVLDVVQRFDAPVLNP